MRLDVIYRCQSCGAISIDGREITGGGAGFDQSPICGCGHDNLICSMELHTRDEGGPP